MGILEQINRILESEKRQIALIDSITEQTEKLAGMVTKMHALDTSIRRTS